jgi:two-component system copper resistance phosphate regulon response regulator CusR
LMMSRSLSVSRGSFVGKNGPSFVVGVRVNASAKAPRAVNAVAPSVSVPRNARRLFLIQIVTSWLPGPDGLAVLNGHRREGGNTPALFLTARDAVSDRVRGLDGGADDYLCKPFAFEELLARARALIRRGRVVEVMTLSYRDVRIDLAAQLAERAGHPLDLTTKELALFVFFLRHPDEVLSRTRIYGHVWGEDYDFVSNTLDVHVKELRHALEARGPRLIHTVRGRGYLLGESPLATAGGGS